MRILVGMEMAPVMIQITMKPAYLMVEIAVDLMSKHNSAQNAYALNEKGKARMQQHHLEDGNISLKK